MKREYHCLNGPQVTKLNSGRESGVPAEQYLTLGCQEGEKETTYSNI